MADNVKAMLSEEIRRELTTLETLEQGSEDQRQAIDNLVKLYRLRIDEAKAEAEASCTERDERFKQEQTRGQAIERYIRLGVELAGIILPLMFYANWMARGFRFEETGTFTSTTFRGLFNRFRPTKV